MNRALFSGLISCCLLAGAISAGALEVNLRTEETIDTVESPQNGASPLWCFGSSILVRDRDQLYVSLLRPDAGFEPYCNAHWELWKRDDEGWSELHRGGEAREREPCPIGLLGEGEVVLSVQPGIMPKPFQDGHGDIPWLCQPGLFLIDGEKIEGEDNVYTNLQPVFPAGSQFSQHSYRGLGVDRENREVLLMVLEQTDEIYQPTWMSRDGNWHPLPLLEFPIRACYPEVVLKDRAAHVFAVGDIVEPNEEWRQAKFEVLNRKWDYAFRRLFYSWSPDLEAAGFSEPIEIDSVDDTAGSIRNLDLLVDREGRAHLLYLKQPHQYAFMRDRFFPGDSMTVSIEYAVVDQGRVVARRTVRTSSAEESLPVGPDAMRLSFGRIHPLPGGGLGVVYSGSWIDDDGGPCSGFYLSVLTDEGTLGRTIALPAERPFTGTFFTNTPRSGSDVGNRLDLVGAIRDGEAFEMRHLGYELSE